MKGIVHIDKATDNYHPTHQLFQFLLQSVLACFSSLFWFMTCNFNVLVLINLVSSSSRRLFLAKKKKKQKALINPLCTACAALNNKVRDDLVNTVKHLVLCWPQKRQKITECKSNIFISSNPIFHSYCVPKHKRLTGNNTCTY